MDFINNALILISGLWDKVFNASKALYAIYLTYKVTEQAQQLKQAQIDSQVLNKAIEVGKKYEEIDSKPFGGRDATLKRMYDDSNTTSGSK